MPVPAGRGRQGGLRDAARGSVPVDGEELEAGREALQLDGLIADELKKRRVAGGEHDGKAGGGVAAGGAAERTQNSSVAGCTVTHRDDVTFYCEPTITRCAQTVPRLLHCLGQLAA